MDGELSISGRASNRRKATIQGCNSVHPRETPNLDRLTESHMSVACAHPMPHRARMASSLVGIALSLLLDAVTTDTIERHLLQISPLLVAIGLTHRQPVHSAWFPLPVSVRGSLVGLHQRLMLSFCIHSAHDLDLGASRWIP